jgi:hypothetical protein
MRVILDMGGLTRYITNDADLVKDLEIIPKAFGSGVSQESQNVIQSVDRI